MKTTLALSLLRLVAGAAMVQHGWGKIQSPFNWMGPDAGTPAIFQALAAVSEFGGGIAWMLGLFTRLASFGILCTMAVAVYTHMILRGDPFVGKGGSYELASIYLCVAVLFLVTGAGKYSIDKKMGKA